MTKLKQFYYDTEALIPTSNILTNNEYVISINIHALPGTTFLFNKTSTITMNATGNFGMDCQDFPITDIQISKAIKQGENLTYPIVIDILYK